MGTDKKSATFNKLSPKTQISLENVLPTGGSDEREERQLESPTVSVGIVSSDRSAYYETRSALYIRKNTIFMNVTQKGPLSTGTRASKA